jgi:hypothetical protein
VYQRILRRIIERDIDMTLCSGKIAALERDKALRDGPGSGTASIRGVARLFSFGEVDQTV